KVIVTHLALDQGFENALPVDGDGVSVVCRKYSIRRPYVLSVGAIGGHKNPRCLIEALTLLRRRSGTETTSLVLTGNDYGAKQEIIAAARALNVDGSVNMPGYIARHDLPALYKGALSYVSLSLYEGFGLTLLEAMACGVPVVASNQASLPEVAGDAVALVSPHNAAQVADALYELAMNDKYREELILRGYSRVKDFSWEA